MSQPLSRSREAHALCGSRIEPHDDASNQATDECQDRRWSAGEIPLQPDPECLARSTVSTMALVASETTNKHKRRRR